MTLETQPAEIDEDHHAAMNGPRIAQSLPKEYLEWLTNLAQKQTRESSHAKE